MDLELFVTEAAQYVTITGLVIISMLSVVGTWFVRNVVETQYPQKLKKLTGGTVVYPTQFSRWWFRVILPTLPVAISMLTCLVKSDIFFGPKLLQDNLVRLLFCIVVGWFSEVVYRGLRQALKARIGVEIPESPVVPTEEEPEDKKCDVVVVTPEDK